MKKNTDTSRTTNFLRNSAVGLIMQFVALVFSFIGRTIFIKYLTNDYLSVNGLFSNIISTLSFAELGFGTALIYMMYKPVAEQNIKKLKTIVAYYKNVYRKIGLIMLGAGLLVIPFMNIIIKNPPNISENLIIIYLLFLVTTCSGYFFSHKTAIINAHQQNYIVSFYNQLFKCIQIFLQIIILIITRDFMLYLIIQLVVALLNNIIISIKANKMYPYLLETDIEPMSEKEKDGVNKKVKSLILYRLNYSLLSGTDNLILSSVIGIASVGIYSNYSLICSYLNMFINQITAALDSSVGNLNANSSKEKKEDIFYKVTYLCFFIYGIVSILLMLVMNDFIQLWLGKEYLLSTFVVFSIILFFYVNGIHFSCYSFRTTSGLFEKAKLVPLIEIILNIVISIVLAKIMGIAGVFLGTSIAKLLTFFWTDPILLYNNIFEKKNIYKYFVKYFKYILIICITCGVAYYIGSFIPVTSYMTWIIKSSTVAITAITMFVAFTFYTTEFKAMFAIFKEKLIQVKNKFLKKEC